MLTGEAVLQRGCEQGSTECQRKGFVQDDSRWAEEKEGKGGWGLKGQHHCGYSTAATVVTQVLVFDIQCLPAQLLRPLIHSTLARSQSGCLCSCMSHSLLQSHMGLLFLPCAPGRLAQPLCSAGVSSKGNGNLAAAFSQSRRRPSWLQVMAKVLGLSVISLCK